MFFFSHKLLGSAESVVHVVKTEEYNVVMLIGRAGENVGAESVCTEIRQQSCRKAFVRAASTRTELRS